MALMRQPKFPLKDLVLIETLAVGWHVGVVHLVGQEVIMLGDFCCQVDSRNRLSRNRSILLSTPSYNLNVYIYIGPICLHIFSTSDVFMNEFYV